MKQLSSIELSFLVKELSTLVGKRLEKIYQLSNQDFLFQFQGKKILRIVLPSLLFITEEKPTTPEKPSDFCMVLRKYLSNSRLRNITQIGSERILELEFEKKEKTKLIIELFSKGNIILLRDKIISALTFHKYSKRTVRGGIPYELPPLRADLFKMKEEEFEEAIKTSKKDSIVTTLATDLGMGGLFAEELCLRADVKKDSKKAGTAKLYREFQGILKAESSPVLILENNQAKDAVPLNFLYYTDYKKMDVSSFSEALSKLFQQQADTASPAEKRYTKELERLLKIAEEQKQTLDKISHEIKDNETKAKYIYEHYQQLQATLELLKQLKKKKQLKKDKLIKEINEKEGKVVVELWLKNICETNPPINPEKHS